MNQISKCSSLQYNKCLNLIVKQPKRNLLQFLKPTPISFKTTQRLPVSQKLFFKVAKDVDEYSKFVPWITYSHVFPNTIKESSSTKKEGLNSPVETKMGSFDAETRIGFSSVNF